MFLKQLSRFTRTISVRLNLWYAVVFTLSAAIGFLLLYVLLSRAVQAKDHEIIETRLKEYALIYGRGGSLGLESYIRRSPEAQKEKSFFVRVIGPFNEQRLLIVPQDWVEFDPRQLRAKGFPNRSFFCAFRKAKNATWSSPPGR